MIHGTDRDLTGPPIPVPPVTHPNSSVNFQLPIIKEEDGNKPAPPAILRNNNTSKVPPTPLSGPFHPNFVSNLFFGVCLATDFMLCHKTNCTNKPLFWLHTESR